jgi:nitrogen fixation NifU-like protein
MAKKINTCSSLYAPKVMAYFKNPHNYGSIKNPDGVGQVGNPTCGDVMKLYIKVSKDKNGKEIIKDIKFQTYGCVAAIATSSVVTDLAKGKTLKQALKIDNKKIVSSLGGLPNIKLHCSVLGADALKEAIKDYSAKNGKK